MYIYIYVYNYIYNIYIYIYAFVDPQIIHGSSGYSAGRLWRKNPSAGACWWMALGGFRKLLATPNHGFSNQITKNLDDQLGYPHDLEKTSIYHHHIYIHTYLHF